MSFLSDAVKMTSFVLVVIVIVHVLLNKVADEEDHHHVERFSEYNNPAPSSFRKASEMAQRNDRYVESGHLNAQLPEVKDEDHEQKKGRIEAQQHDELYDFVHSPSSPPAAPKAAASSSVVRASKPIPPAESSDAIRPYSATGAFGDAYESF